MAKAANEMDADPVPGMHERGDMSTSRYALTKREAAFFNAGSPAAGGYLFATPSSRALFSASTPIFAAGSPGMP